jgi:hypothetical protein
VNQVQSTLERSSDDWARSPLLHRRWRGPLLIWEDECVACGTRGACRNQAGRSRPRGEPHSHELADNKQQRRRRIVTFKPVLSPGMRLEIRALFGLYDSDGRGAVSVRHMHAALTGCGLDQAEVDNVLRRGGVTDEGCAIGPVRFEALMEATGIWY